MAKADLESLIGDSYEGAQSRICWAAGLKGQAADYIHALDERADHPNFAAVSRILQEHFSIRIGESSVRQHFRGKCRCRR